MFRRRRAPVHEFTNSEVVMLLEVVRDVVDPDSLLVLRSADGDDVERTDAIRAVVWRVKGLSAGDEVRIVPDPV